MTTYVAEIPLFDFLLLFAIRMMRDERTPCEATHPYRTPLVAVKATALAASTTRYVADLLLLQIELEKFFGHFISEILLSFAHPKV